MSDEIQESSDETREPLYSIDKISKILNVTPRTLRFYEQKGLIEPIRLGYKLRKYTDADLSRLKEIILFAKMGFTLLEIKSGPITKAKLQQRLAGLHEELEMTNEAIDLVKTALKQG